MVPRAIWRESFKNNASFNSHRKSRLPVSDAQANGTSPLSRCHDKNTKLLFFIYTGAALGVSPAGRSARFKKGDVTLPAARDSFINRLLFSTVSPRFWASTPLTWQFLVAEVTQPIIGADFLLKLKLFVDLDDDA